MSSQFDLLAASLRADAVDLAAFVEALAVKLSASFPARVKIERTGGRLRGKVRVRRLHVSLGDGEYELASEAGQVRCSRRVLVRGIALRTEELTIEQWIDRLAAELVALNVNVLVTSASASAAAAKRATSAIPIVFTLAPDPLGNGFVSSLAHPGGNLTGLSIQTTDLQRLPVMPPPAA